VASACDVSYFMGYKLHLFRYIQNVHLISTKRESKHTTTTPKADSGVVDFRISSSNLSLDGITKYPHFSGKLALPEYRHVMELLNSTCKKETSFFLCVGWNIKYQSHSSIFYPTEPLGWNQPIVSQGEFFS